MIQADPSKDGLEVCLIQDEHPVAYASWALTDTEKSYAQIEKELLAIVLAVKRFQSDHKPLEIILRIYRGSSLQTTKNAAPATVI